MAPESEFKKYCRLIMHRKFMFVLAFVATVIIGISISYILPEKYEAKSTVFIEKSVITDLVKGLAVTQDIESRLRILSYSLNSRNLLVKVMEDLEIDTSDAAVVGYYLGKFRKNIQIEFSGRDGRQNMNLFIIKYQDENPVFARNFVNSLIRKYIEENLSASREESYGANRFIQEQVESFRGRIREVEMRISRLKQEEGFELLNDESSLLMEIRNTQAILDDLGLKKEELMAKQRLLSRRASPEGQGGNTLTALENKREQLLLMYTENYPEVVLINAEIERIRRQMAAMEMRGLASPAAGEPNLESALIEIEVNALAGREMQLRRILEENNTLLAALPAKRKMLTDLEQERDSFLRTYQELVNRHGQSEVSKQMEIQDKAGSFRIVDPAFLPDRPVSPKRVSFILFSLLAGVGLGFGMIIGLDRLDASVKGMDAVRDLGIPVLAVIPRFSTKDERSREKRANTALAVFVAIFLVGVSLLLILESMNMVRPGGAMEMQEKTAGLIPVVATIVNNLC
jgi:polysaccharide biosynthesis transport protein